MFHNRYDQFLLDQYSEAGVEVSESELEKLTQLVNDHYPTPKWKVFVIKFLKPESSPLGAVIGNYAVVDEAEGTTLNHIVINDVKQFSIAEEHGIEEDDEILGPGLESLIDIHLNLDSCHTG